MKRYLLSLLAVPLVLAGCAQTPSSNPPASQAVDSLDAFHWQLTDATDRGGKRLDYLFVQPSTPVQMDFKTNRFSVSNTCNVINGTYLLTDNVITFSNMLSTKMLCANPQLNTLEQKVATQLQNRANIDLFLSATPVMRTWILTGSDAVLPDAIYAPVSASLVITSYSPPCLSPEIVSSPPAAAFPLIHVSPLSAEYS